MVGGCAQIVSAQLCIVRESTGLSESTSPWDIMRAAEPVAEQYSVCSGHRDQHDPIIRAAGPASAAVTQAAVGFNISCTVRRVTVTVTRISGAATPSQAQLSGRRARATRPGSRGRRPPRHWQSMTRVDRPGGTGAAQVRLRSSLRFIMALTSNLL